MGHDVPRVHFGKKCHAVMLLTHSTCIILYKVGCKKVSSTLEM